MSTKKKSKVIKLSPEQKTMLIAIAEKNKGRVLFAKQVERLNKLFSNITFVSSKGQAQAEIPE